MYSPQIITLFLLSSLTASNSQLKQAHALAFSTQTQISICQNKDCIKKFKTSSNSDGGVIQMMIDLIPPSSVDDIIINSSGCLSQCGYGPNVCIKSEKERSNGEGERVFHEVKDVQTAAAVLEVGGGIDCPIELMVAVDMIGQASRTTNITKKIDILSKVIESLQCPQYLSTNAISHAYIMRADAYIEQKQQQPKEDTLIPRALEDISKAIPINHLHGRAYRVQADAYEALGDIIKAMEAIENWAKVNPAFVSKAKNELSRLSMKM